MVYVNSTIFKTITDETTGAIKSIGLFGKSFTELKEILNSVKTNGLFKAKLINETDIECIKKYNNAIALNIPHQKAMKHATIGASNATKQMIKNANGNTIALNQMTLGAKAANVAVKALSLAMNIGLSLAINAGISLFSSWVHAQENARKAAQEATEAFKEEANAIDDYIEKATELRKELDKGNLSYEDAQTARSDLMVIQDALIEKYGEEAKSIDLVTGSIEEQTKAIHDLKKAEYADAYGLDKSNIDKTIKEMNKKSISINFAKANPFNNLKLKDSDIDDIIYNIFKDEFKDLNILGSFDDVDGSFVRAFYDGGAGTFTGDIYALDEALKNTFTRLSDLEVADQYKDEIDEILTYISKLRKNKVNDTLQESDETFSEWVKYGEEYSDNYYDLIRKQENVRAAIANGTTEEIEQKKIEYTKSYASMAEKALEEGDAGVISWLKRNGFSDFLNEFEEDVNDVSNTVKQDTIPSITDLTTAYGTFNEKIKETIDLQNKLADVFQKVANGEKFSASEVYDLISEIPELTNYLKTLDDGGFTFSADGISLISDNLTQKEKDNIQSKIDEAQQIIDNYNSVKTRMENAGSLSYESALRIELSGLESGKADAQKLVDAYTVLQNLLDSMFDEHQMTLDSIDEKYNTAKSSIDGYNDSIKTIDSAIDKLNEGQALTHDEMIELVEISPKLSDSIEERSNGYYIEVDALKDLRFESKEARNQFIDDQIEMAKEAITAAEVIVAAHSLINSATDWENNKKALQEQWEIIRGYKEDIAIWEQEKKEYIDDSSNDGGTGDSGNDPITTAFEKELKYLDYLRDMGMISAKEYYKQLFFLNEKYYSDNDKYLEQYRDNEVKIRDGITDIEIRAIDRQIEALEVLKEKREEEKELQELQIELEEKKLELLNKQSQKNVRYYDAEKREWVWTYNRNDVADAQKAVDEAQETLDEHLYQSNEDKKIEQLEQIKEILQGDEDNPNNPVQFVGSEGVTTKATGRSVTFEEFVKSLGATQPIDTTKFWNAIYSTGLQPNVQKIAESTHNQNYQTVNRNVTGNTINVTVNGSNLSADELSGAIENGVNDALMDLANQLWLKS